MAKVTIVIATWNSKRYLEDALGSVERQTFRDFSVLIVDNASSDGTVEFIRERFPTMSVLRNNKNLGFAKPYNQGLQLARSEYALVMNHDVILEDDFLATIIAFAEQHPKAASFGGKVLKVTTRAYDASDQGVREAIRSRVIDETGLQIFKNRMVINRGEGETDIGQFEKPEEVFGVSGACALYRLAALQDVAIHNEYFDQDFFAYKEDVDLAWRLRWYGYESWYCPTAHAYHYRGLSAPAQGGVIAKIKHRRGVSRRLRTLSFRNHHLMLIKNDRFGLLGISIFSFILIELKWLASLLIEPFQWKTLFSIFSALPRTWAKRTIIKRHSRVPVQELRKWFV